MVSSWDVAATASRNLNPDRIGASVGRSEPAGAAVPEGDGKKPMVPAGGPGGLGPRIQRLQSWEQSSRGLVMPSRCDAVVS